MISEEKLRLDEQPKLCIREYVASAVMIVFVAGMPRSGSTFAFNVARDVLMERGTVYQDVSDDVLGTISRAGASEHILMKAHAATAPTIALAQRHAIRTIVTVRRVEDSAASWIKTFGFSEDETVQQLRIWLVLYRELRRTSLVIPYEDIDQRPWLAADQIGRYVARDVSVLESLSISNRHSKSKVKRQTDTLSRDLDSVQDIGFSHYDRATYFHRRHVSTMVSLPAEQRLPLNQIARIREALSEYISEAGL